MNKFPKIFVVILNYNGKETIKSCLSSFFASDYPNRELVLIDNNSTDGSFELAKTLFSRAYFIKNNENFGFSAGNNIGIRFALEKMADYVMLLNNDASLEKSTLSILAKEAERKKGCGIIGPLIIKGDSEKIWFAGGKINWLRMKNTHITELPPKKEFLETDYVCGCAMLIKKEVFRKIGLLDEKFFLYYEDADFCVRAKRQGFSSYIFPGARIRHFEKSEQNNPLKTYWLVISGAIFFKKNFQGAKRIWISFYLILRRIKNFIDAIFNLSPSSQEVGRAYKELRIWEKKNNYLS